MCEAEKVKRLRRFPAWCLRFSHRRPTKLYQPGLFGMERQPIFGESLSQYFQHSFRILLVLKAQNEIISESHFVRFASQPGLHFLLEPLIQHVVKIDICQQGTDYLPLTDPLLTRQEPTFVDHPDVDPFAYQPQDTSVFDPPLNHLHECLSHDGVKISGDVSLQYPANWSLADDPP